MTTTRRSHADCTHPRTAAGRAACRKGTGPSLEQMIADVAMEAEMDITCPPPVDYATMNYSFETHTCGRCLGSGTYPSSAWNGVCLGCNGSGKNLTRAGRAAKKIHDAWIDTHLMISATSLKPGDRFQPNKIDGWKTVVSIDPTLTISYYSVERDAEGNETRTPHYGFTVTTQKTTYGLLAESIVQRAATWDERNELIGRIAKLKGTVLTPKNA